MTHVGSVERARLLSRLDRRLAAVATGAGTPGERLVAYLRRAEWFLAVGGCPECATLSESIGRGRWCRCGRVRDPILDLLERPAALRRASTSAAEVVRRLLADS